MDTPSPADPKEPAAAPPGAVPPKLPRQKPRRARFFFVVLALLAMVPIIRHFRQSETIPPPAPETFLRRDVPRFDGPPPLQVPPQPNPLPGPPEPVRKPRPKPEVVTGPRAPAPAFSKPGGVYREEVQVELLPGSADSKVRYTLDGSEPGPNSPACTGPLTLSSTVLVKAKAFGPGIGPSVTVSQTYTFLDGSLAEFGSNLPLVIINTFGQQISKEIGIPASLRVIEAGAKRSTLTAPGEYEGRCEIKFRGFSSLRLPKRSFTIKTRDDSDQPRSASILGMPEDSEWVLYAPYSDKTMMRDVLAYELSNKMGRYAARTRYVEVFVMRRAGNLSKRDYAGVYVFEEKIKQSKDRVNIQKLTPEDKAEPNITGGYIFKRDHTSPPMDAPFMFGQNRSFGMEAETGFVTSRGLHLFYVEPKETEITAPQKAYLSRYMGQLERALYGSDFRSPTDGYARYLDVDSFIDQFWIVELSKNVDGFRYSCYMSKDRGGKLRLEPIWDWNLSFGNANYHDGWTTENWYWPQLRENEVSWIRRLRQDPDFIQRLTDRWLELRKGPLTPESILERIDELSDQLREAQARNYERWPILGQFVNPNWYVGDSFEDEVNWMKNWIQERIAWIDSQFLPAPALSARQGSKGTGVQVNMRGTAGAVYYTTDGSDPRLPGGAVSPKAREYSEPVILEVGTRVTARTRAGERWSGPAVGKVAPVAAAGRAGSERN